MKSYRYKIGSIVNGWRILYKYTNKYKYFNSEKNYAYRVQCILCGEERDLYGVNELVKKCSCKKAERTMNTLKKEYNGKVFNNIKIINFFYEKENGIICVYKDLVSNRIHRKAFYRQTINGIKYEAKQELQLIRLTTVEKCEKLLETVDFKIKDVSYHTIKELVDKFKITKSGCISYIRKNDFEGLRLYALFTKHRYKTKSLKNIF